MGKKTHRLYLKVFGNTLGVKTNAIYWLHHNLCKLKSQSANSASPNGSPNPQLSPTDVQSKVDELRTRGFTRIPNIPVEALAKPVKDYFDSRTVDNGWCIMERKDAGFLAPDLYQAMKTVDQVLRAYYDSHYQYYWTEVRRTNSDGKWDANSSFGFHTDDNPKELMKVFFYLNDTYEINGAFRAFDYQVSKQLFESGFISYSSQTRVDSQKLVTPELIQQKLNVLEGLKGTALIFDNNLVHRASVPREGFRDVIGLEVYPSGEQMTVEHLRKSLVNPYITDYPHNPFRNEVLQNLIKTDAPTRSMQY